MPCIAQAMVQIRSPKFCKRIATMESFSSNVSNLTSVYPHAVLTSLLLTEMLSAECHAIIARWKDEASWGGCASGSYSGAAGLNPRPAKHCEVEASYTLLEPRPSMYSNDI